VPAAKALLFRHLLRWRKHQINGTPPSKGSVSTADFSIGYLKGETELENH
jgi:hypothetical protein